MLLEIYTIGSLRRFLVFGLFIMSLSVHASETPQSTTSGANEVVMGKVEYELPDNLGTLTLKVPLHWVGASVDGLLAAWVDQDGSSFKDNVTLSIREGDKVTDTDELLERTIGLMVNSAGISNVSDIEKTEARRLVSYDRTVESQAITQTALIIYTESADKSYLLMLNHSRPIGVDAIDLNQAKIK